MKKRFTSGTGSASLLLALIGLLPGIAEAESSSPGMTASTALPEEQRVGELGFQITSLRVSQRDNLGNSVAAVALTIRNYGPQPISLTYLDDSASMSDDRGYRWKDAVDSYRNSTGIALTDHQGASLESVIDPAGELRVTIPLSFGLNPGQTPGSSFDFQASFAAYEDLGQGKIRRIRQYPVSVVGLQPNTARSVPVPGAQQIEDGLKKAIGGLFGQ